MSRKGINMPEKKLKKRRKRRKVHYTDHQKRGERDTLIFECTGLDQPARRRAKPSLKKNLVVMAKAEMFYSKGHLFPYDFEECYCQEHLENGQKGQIARLQYRLNDMELFVKRRLGNVAPVATYLLFYYGVTKYELINKNKSIKTENISIELSNELNRLCLSFEKSLSNPSETIIETVSIILEKAHHYVTNAYISDTLKYTNEDIFCMTGSYPFKGNDRELYEENRQKWKKGKERERKAKAYEAKRNILEEGNMDYSYPSIKKQTEMNKAILRKIWNGSEFDRNNVTAVASMKELEQMMCLKERRIYQLMNEVRMEFEEDMQKV